MLAEIHNKISRTSAIDRLEDQLTGDIFGALRYLPLNSGIRPALSQVRFQTDDAHLKWQSSLDHCSAYEYEVEFWRRHSEGEIDLIITLPDALVGIEVKYRSGLSSDDEEGGEEVDPEESQHQLIRYSRLIDDIGGAKNKFLIFLAPYNTMSLVRKSINERSLHIPDVHLGFLSWQDVLESLEQIDVDALASGQQLIIRDLIQLLEKKEFSRFSGFSKAASLMVTEKVYLFKSSTYFTRNNLSWPTQSVSKEDVYVFTR